MKTLKHSAILLIILVLGSCSPKVMTELNKSYEPLDYNQEVVVIGIDQSVPEGSEELGQIKIGDSGFTTNCDYETVINKAKEEVRKAGGNSLKITEHKPPTVMGSSCHRITATILKLKDPQTFIADNSEEELLDIDYAIINVYRYSGAGALVNYDLHLGDSVLCRVKNNFKTTVHTKLEGLNSIWAKTEAKAEIPVDIKYGKVYYIRCGIGMGFFVGQPTLELVDSKIGKAEFEAFNAKNQ